MASFFVDSNLNIRKFTEYIGREFQLMEHDIGRSIQIFAHSFPYEKIVEDAQNVLKNLSPIDREVVATNGQFYTLRNAPYRTTETASKALDHHHRQPGNRVYQAGRQIETEQFRKAASAAFFLWI